MALTFSDAFRRNPLTRQAVDTVIQLAVTKWLQFARDREGGRAERHNRVVTPQATVSRPAAAQASGVRSAGDSCPAAAQASGVRSAGDSRPAAAQASGVRPDTAQASGGRSAGGNRPAASQASGGCSARGNRPATEESEDDEGQGGADRDNNVEGSGEEVN